MAKTISAKKLRVLHVAKWYPNRNDVQNGVFVQKQIMATTPYAEVKVLAWLPGNEKTHTHESHENGLAVTRTFFKPRTAISVKRHAFLQYIHSHYNNKNLPELLHLHVFSPDLLVMVLWAKKKGIPVVITEHWSGYMRGIFDALPKWRKWSYKRIAKVNRVLPVSGYLQVHMQRSGLAGVYTIVPNVVDVDFPSTQKVPGFAFVMVADVVDEIKNISGVIAAFEAVYKTTQNISLHLIGGGPDEEDIAQKVENSTAKSAIHLYGRLPNAEVKALLPQFHCLVLNSRVETFGVVVLEAHAAGLPAIVTRCGGPEEWLEDADIAIAVDDSTALQHALAEMAGRKNQDYIFTKHLRCSAEMVGEQLHDVYQKVLAEEARKENSKAKR
jgi:glycosyltransferase involved in cell wall biosynthesis